MRWDDFRRSDNIEDDRGAGGGFGGGGSGIQFGGGGLGIGTVIVLGLLGWALGIDPSVLIGGAELINGGSQYQQQSRPANRRVGTPSDATGQFVAAVLGNTEDTWGEIFRAGGQQYAPPRLRLYTGGEQGGCGFAQAAMGPFYCPTDRRIYLDTSFFREIETRFHGCQGKACEFVASLCDRARGRPSRAESARHAAESKRGPTRRRQPAAANRIQVRVELQADCFAGVWAHHSDQRRNFARSRRHRRRAADRDRHRRRHAAAAARKATSCRTRSPTARPSSASAGSPSVSSKAHYRPATLSRRRRSSSCHSGTARKRRTRNPHAGKADVSGFRVRSLRSRPGMT